MVVNDAEEAEELMKALQSNSENFDYIIQKVRINRQLAIKDMAKIWNVTETLSAMIINTLIPPN